MQIQHVQVKNILNKTKISRTDYTANPYVGCSHNCLYCYAAYMQTFNPHTSSWGNYVDIKHWPDFTPKQKEAIAGKAVCIGTVTDPYQPLEYEVANTQRLLYQLRELECSLLIITKSDLVLRDLELLKGFPDVEIAWSICTLDERLRFDIEPSTIPIQRRLAAMETFYQQGFKTSCFIAPVFPVFTDVFSIIQQVRNKCHEVLLDPLNLRCQNRQTIFNYINQVFPQLFNLYHQIYYQNDQNYWYQLSEQIEAFAANQGLFLNGKAASPLFSQSPNIICHFGKFQHLDNFLKPNPSNNTPEPSSKAAPTPDNTKNTTQKGFQASLFDLDNFPD